MAVAEIDRKEHAEKLAKEIGISRRHIVFILWCSVKIVFRVDQPQWSLFQITSVEFLFVMKWFTIPRHMFEMGCFTKLLETIVDKSLLCANLLDSIQCREWQVVFQPVLCFGSVSAGSLNIFIRNQNYGLTHLFSIWLFINIIRISNQYS